MHMHSILTNKIPVSNKHLQGTILKFNFSPSFLFSLIFPLLLPSPPPSLITAQHLSEYKLKNLHL